MPGIVKMENGGQNGTRTDHHRDPTVNGINGSKTIDGSRAAPDKGKAGAAGHDANSVEVNGAEADGSQATALAKRRSRMNDLPEEIIHITQGFVPLSLLLTRLAQTTHNALQDKIAELAKMPIPAAAMNGNSSLAPASPDDASTENIRKKVTLLHFAQDMHAKWVKALVIVEWSRKASMVSKLIDLKFHIDQQRIIYDAALDNVVNVKRDLTYARMPCPDLKTGLHVLSTGTAPWMPDLQYIEPPPLTPDEQMKWINDLNTLLSLRLNLDDYDKIPFHFKDYEIGSGRVTFKVPGEFDVDLTIADEDFEKQFWFIDFRFTFSPSASSLTETLRAHLEVCVNEALAKDGLAGCYQFLHEFVLTSKINELKRQAIQLSRTSWTGTLMVEPLNRALAIQYWTSRNPGTGLKSWVLVAVNSGRKPNGRPDPKSASHLVAKWYRDNKEIKDVEIELDAENLSAESLLKKVIGRHVEFLLSSIHKGLLAAPRFKNGHVAMGLQISKTDPGASLLAMQVGHDSTVSLSIEPTSGAFAVAPHSKFSVPFEHQLNNGKDDGVTCLENVRCGIMDDEVNRRGSPLGWLVRKAPITAEELRSITKMRRWTRVIWLQRQGWTPAWFVAVILSLDGDEWWLLETYDDRHPTVIISGLPADRLSRNSSDTHGFPRFQAKLPLDKDHPDLSDGFWDNLTLFATGMITQSVDRRELYRHSIKSRSNDSLNLCLPQEIRLPAIELALSALLPAIVCDGTDKTSSVSATLCAESVPDDELTASLFSEDTPLPKQPWADDIVTIVFRGVESVSEPGEGNSEGGVSNPELTCAVDAVIKVRRPTKFAALNGMVDRDVSYNARRGEFSLRIRRRVTEPIVATIKSRIKAIDRFVNFLEAMDKTRGAIVTQSVTLRRVAFSYGEPSPEEQDDEDSATQSWTVVMDLSQDDIDIKIEKGNPHLRVIDLTRQLANSDFGIGSLMAWLPASLPALKAIHKIETQWDDLAARGLGRVDFSMKTIAWINLVYTVFGPSGSSGSNGEKTKTKKQASTDVCKDSKVSVDARIRTRQGEPWWHVSRSKSDAKDDEVSKALKPVWDGSGGGWVGLGASATGKPGGGVAKLLLAVDKAIQEAIPALGQGASGAQGSSSQNQQGGGGGGGGSGNIPVVVLD